MTFVKETYRGFYKGFTIVCLLSTPAHSLYFAGYEFGKSRLFRDVNSSPLSHFLSGMTAELAGACCWVPMDVIKQKLQIQSGFNDSYSGTWNCAKTIVKEEGPMGLYRGLGASLLTYAPFVGMYFMTYEKSKVMFSSHMQIETHKLPFWIHLFSGALAGAIAAIITNPLDLVKTRIQTQRSGITLSAKYRRVIPSIRLIYGEEGLSAFGKGMLARVLWIAPGTAISIAVCK